MHVEMEEPFRISSAENTEKYWVVVHRKSLITGTTEHYATVAETFPQ